MMFEAATSALVTPTSGGVTLADVYAANMSCIAKPKNRSNRLKALERTGELAGLPLDKISCDLSELESIFDQAMEVRHDISAQEIGITRDHLRKALRASNLIPSFASIRHKISPAWEQVYAITRGNSAVRTAIRWADLSLLTPADITDAIIVFYRMELIEDGVSEYLARLRVAKFRDVLMAARDANPGANIKELAIVVTDERPELHRASPAYYESVDAYVSSITRRSGEDPKSLTANGRKKVEASSAETMRKYLAAAADAVGISIGAENLTNIEDFAKLETFVALQRGLAIRAEQRPSRTNRKIMNLIIQTLEDVGISKDRLSPLRAIRDAAPVPTTQLSEQTLDAIGELLTTSSRTALLNLPARLWQEAKGLEKSDVRLLRYQVAVVLALLLTLPLWLHELVDLQLNRTIIVPEDGPASILYRKKWIELNADTSAMLQKLTIILRDETGAAPDFLFATRNGRHRERGENARYGTALSHATTKAIQRCVGLRLTLNALRFVPALLLLLRDSADDLAVMQLYGITSEDTYQRTFRPLIHFAKKHASLRESRHDTAA